MQASRSIAVAFLLFLLAIVVVGAIALAAMYLAQPRGADRDAGPPAASTR
jgi:hypothetical protein